MRSPLLSWPLLLANKGALLLVTGIGLWLAGTRVWTEAGILLGGYILLTTIYLLAVPRPSAAAQPPDAQGAAHTPLIVWGHTFGVILDMGLVLYLVYASGGAASPFWPLVGLQTFFPAFYLPWNLVTWLGAFASGPLYVLVLWLHSRTLSFLPDPLFLARYSVLFLAVIGGALAADLLQQSRQRQQQLQQTLATREADLDAQAKRLQRTAADLGDRVLQLRALQEVARDLAATLDLPATLQVLIDRLAALTNARHAAIALLEHDGHILQGLAASGDSAHLFRRFAVYLPDDPASAQRLADGRVVASDTVDQDDSIRNVLGFDTLRALWRPDVAAAHPVRILCLPLGLRGRPVGALYLADDRSDFDTDRQRQLLDSFAYFAAAAVDNARLYQAVADKSRELETILAGIGDAVLVVDADLHLMLMNPVAVHIFGLEAAPPAGLPLRMLIENPVLLDLLAEVKASPDAALIREVELAHAGSRPPIYQALAAPLVVGSSLQGIATVLRDVTSQKELERMKSNFLSVVSHELKTPLHSIKGFVDIILMGKTGPVTAIQRDFLETVKQQTDHLQRMIDDLLEFSRLESGRVTLRLQPVDIPVVVEAVIDKLTPLADSSEVTLVNHVPDTIPTLSADPWRIEQVVTNLVDNAIKFTPSHGIVTISASDQAEMVEIKVQDTGIGIPADELDRIFDRFYQVDGGANRLYKGTGLGLTICRHIIEHHGGHIWAESDYGHGATFSFTLPKSGSPATTGALDFTTLPTPRQDGR